MHPLFSACSVHNGDLQPWLSKLEGHRPGRGAMGSPVLRPSLCREFQGSRQRPDPEEAL